MLTLLSGFAYLTRLVLCLFLGNFTAIEISRMSGTLYGFTGMELLFCSLAVYQRQDCSIHIKGWGHLKSGEIRS